MSILVCYIESNERSVFETGDPVKATRMSLTLSQSLDNGIVSYSNMWGEAPRTMFSCITEDNNLFHTDVDIQQCTVFLKFTHGVSLFMNLGKSLMQSKELAFK